MYLEKGKEGEAHLKEDGCWGSAHCGDTGDREGEGSVTVAESGSESDSQYGRGLDSHIPILVFEANFHTLCCASNASQYMLTVKTAQGQDSTMKIKN